jgi:opacity protein-like surface antigen
VSGSDDGEDVSWGVGLGFDFADNLGVTVEYQAFEIEDTDTVDLISAALVWKF